MHGALPFFIAIAAAAKGIPIPTQPQQIVSTHVATYAFVHQAVNTDYSKTPPVHNPIQHSRNKKKEKNQGK